MDPFEKAAQGVAGGFDDAAAQVVGDQSSGLRNTLYDALLSNPDVSARATKLGRKTGLAPELVERNLPEIERSTRLDQLDALPKDNPILAGWLADPVNARLAHDDLDTLDLISKSTLLRTPAVPKLSESYGFSQASRDIRASQQKSESAVSQYLERNMPASEIFGRERTVAEGITEPFMRGLARGRRGITLLMGMGGLYEGADAELAVRLGQQNRQAEAYPIPENVQAGNQAISEADGFGEAAWAILSNPGALKETVIESMGVSAPSLLGAAGLSALGPLGTAAGAGLGSFAVEYGATIQDVMSQNGVNASDPLAINAALNDPNIMAAAREKALARGLPIAMFDALTAGFAGKLLAGAKNTAGSAGLRTAGELGIQAGGGAAGEATAQALTGEFKPGEILLEAIAELPTGLIEIPANFQHARDKASRAETNAKAIEEINSFAQSAKVLQRDPETFQTFIAAAAEDGPVQNVFIDGRTLMQSGMAPSLAELSPAVREQLDRAILTGGMIAIPVDEYAARIAPTEFAPQLLDHLKTDAEGFSRTEAADFMANQGAELQAEVERVIGNQADADTFRASQDVVKADILGQLNTAGRFTPQVNEAYATLASAYSAVRAAQLGMTPEAFHAERGMRVQGAAVAGDKFDQTGKLVTDTQAFANWFGESKVKDADGRPLVVFHGSGESIGAFDPSKSNTGAFFFTANPSYAASHTAQIKGLEGGYLNPSYLALKNPKTITATDADFSVPSYEREQIAIAKEEGHDGVIFQGSKNTFYAAFDSRQVKSYNNKGTFDPADPNILNQEGFKADTLSAIVGQNASYPGSEGTSSSNPAARLDIPGTEVNGVLNQPAIPILMGTEKGHESNMVSVVDVPPMLIDGVPAQVGADYYTSNLQGTSAENPSIGEVRFSSEGKGKLFSQMRGNPLRARIVAALPEMVRASEIVGVALDNKQRGDVDGFKYAVVPVRIDGKLYAVEMTFKIGDGAKGEAKFYTLDGYEMKAVNSVLGLDSGNAEGNPDQLTASAVSVGVMLSEINSLNKVFQPDGGAATPRGSFSPASNTITLLQNADLSTFLHESAHYFFETDIALASELVAKSRQFGNGSLSSGEQQIIDDVNALLKWHGIHGGTVVHLSQQDRAAGAEIAEMARQFDMTPRALVEAWKAKPPKPNSSQGVLWGKLDGIPELALFAAENPGAFSVEGPGTAIDVWNNLTFEEQRSHHERTAESFEAYLFSGTAPNLELQPMFQRFRAWMVNVYKSIKDFLAKNPEAGKLNDEVRSVFDRMIATQEQIALAEQARSLTALFASPETSGMTPEAFAAYQALGVDATNTAIEQLQAKGLRDMQWLTNARGREIKKLQKESKAARAEVTMEARRAVMSQPVYRAWDFLTRKLSDNDKLPPLERKSDPDVLDPTLDSLFVAIAKLGGIKKAQVLSEWGADPKDIPQSGLFGKPVWRVTEGLPIDSMAAALAEHGYLPLNQHGQYELNDLGDRFLAELAGDTQYSDYHQPQDLLPGEQIANPAGLMAGRIEYSGLAAIGIPDEIADHVKALKMTATDGLHPDLVASLFEFSSGDELVRTLASAPTPKEAINALAEQMMLERFGELSSPDAIERAADQAIHNDVRARMLTTEVNALAQAIGKPKILASAAKAFAADMIARLKVRDVRPGQYANAEARAAKAAAKAKGDVATAAAEKRNQIIQHYATRAAYDAQDEVKAGLRYLKKFDKRSKTIDPEYQDQIEAMLERFELRALSSKAVDRRASLAKWIEAQREAGLEPDIAPELENEAFRTSYKNITVEEFRGLVDAVKQIEHLGRLKNKLLTAQDQRAFKAIVEEVSASIIENGGKARPVELETPKGIRPWLEGVAAGHRKMASLIRQMDGLKDGGPFWRVLVRGMNEASTNETVMIEQATEKLAELYKPMLELKGGLNGDKRFIQAINDSLTRGGRLSVALNWGNAANRQRVMDGDQWSEQQVHAILKTLTRDEWAFVQNVWTFIDSFWPQIEAKEKRVTGRAPDKVAAEPFAYMVDGEMVSLTGGYYPIKYDSNRDDRAEKHDAAAIAQDMMRGAMTRSTTRRGHTKARTEAVNRPVKKTLDVITQHVSEVTHDLAWHEWLVDANRLLDAKPINQAIRDYYGTEVLRTMKDALTSIATADIIPQDAVDRALLYLRANVSRSTMGFSLTTAFLQPFGLLQSMVRIGAKPVLRGMARWAGDAARFESSMTWISEKSDFMRLRSKTFNRELHEIKGRVSHGHSRARTIYDASLFMLMQKMQMVADVPTWIGAYEKALAENHDEATAVAMADQSVLDSQGGGQTKDMAAFQRKHPFMAMFYSYFSTTMNLAAESTAATNFKNPLAVAGWASDMVLLMVIPALGPAMILAMMKGEECGDPEECAVKLASAQAGYLMNLMLGVREFAGLTSGFDYSGPPVGRVVTELQRTGKQVGQGEADEALAMSSIKLLGVALGIPTTQILRSYRGWKAWEDGEAPATSILMGPPPKD